MSFHFIKTPKLVHSLNKTLFMKINLGLVEMTCGLVQASYSLPEWQAVKLTFLAVYDICRLQTADCRPQIADCKLKDTKNLPNKGDTIKNITSCESEKVAWEQG